MAEEAHSSEPPNSSQITTQLSDVRVNQTTMDILRIAGVPQPQPINGPADGEPEYLIPQYFYTRYITHMSQGSDNVNNNPCPIAPSLLENNNTMHPQQRSQRPQPRPN